MGFVILNHLVFQQLGYLRMSIIVLNLLLLTFLQVLTTIDMKGILVPTPGSIYETELSTRQNNSRNRFIETEGTLTINSLSDLTILLH